MALTHGYTGLIVWDTDHVLQTRADITVDAARGTIDVTCHGDANLPFRRFEVGLFDPIEITIPILWDYTLPETAEMAQKLICGTNTSLLFEDAVASAHPHILGNAKVTKIGLSAQMENEMQIMNVTFLFSGAPTTLFGETI
jgi:hypothetical protein